MKATIESTDLIVDVGGVPARVWNGRTENGVEFLAFITRLAVPEGQDCTQFESELREEPHSKLVSSGLPAGQIYLRLIL
jgi:hypothetical protein